MSREVTRIEATEERPRRRNTAWGNSFYTIRHYKDFRYLWAGNFFTVGAQWIQILTIGWLVLRLTDGNALLTGTVVGLRSLPVLAIGPWAGVMADRLDRRKLVVVTQLCMAVASTRNSCPT